MLIFPNKKIKTTNPPARANFLKNRKTPYYWAFSVFNSS